MKKYLKVLLVLVFSVLVITGCKMKTDIEFEINKEDMKLNAIYAFDDEFIDFMIEYNKDSNITTTMVDENGNPDFSKVPKHTDQERWDFIENSDDEGNSVFGSIDVNDKYELKKYDRDGLKGYVITFPMGKLDDYSVPSASKKYDLAELFSGEELPANAPLFIKDGNTYKSNMTYKVTDTTEVEQMKEYLEANIVFNLPNPASSNNALKTSNNNKTLTFDMFKGGDINFTFTYDESSADTPRSYLARFVEGDLDNNNTNNSTETKNKDNKNSNKTIIIIAIIAVCLVIIIVAVIIIIVVATSSKKTVTPVEPVQPTE